MPTTNNKVKFGIKNCFYAVATIADDGSATYANPVALKGAVSLSLEAQGDNSPFYADDITYYMSAANSGYQGDLELALILIHSKRTYWDTLKTPTGSCMRMRMRM